MRYFMVFSYDGSKFHGFERQKDVKSVQKTIEDGLSLYLHTKIVIKASGRTDALVHALSQCAHFDYDQKLPHDLKAKLNELFQQEIIIKKIKRVADDFHARFNVVAKTYRYIMNTKPNEETSVYYQNIYYPLDINKMREASKILLGKHDFRNFVSGKRDNYETIIYKITIKKKRNLIIFEFTGAGFYRYMVRHLVGALYDVGRGKVEKETVKKMVDNPDISKNLTVMPANGLYLVNVKY